MLKIAFMHVTILRQGLGREQVCLNLLSIALFSSKTVSFRGEQSLLLWREISWICHGIFPLGRDSLANFLKSAAGWTSPPS